MVEKKALHGDPAKSEEFTKLLVDFKAKRMGELFKDHPNLLSGLNVLLPAQAKNFIPHEPELPDDAEVNKIKVNPNNMVENLVAAKPSVDDAYSYVTAVQKAFHGELAKFIDFLNLFCDLSSKRSLYRVDPTSLNARVGELFKDHPNLISGLNDFLPAEAKIIVPPEPEQPTELPDHIKRKREAAEDLLNKIKKRFQTCDTHVPKDFLKIMNEYKERKKSKEEVREEVIDLIYYHEDLRAEFLKYLQ